MRLPVTTVFGTTMSSASGAGQPSGQNSTWSGYFKNIIGLDKATKGNESKPMPAASRPTPIPSAKAAQGPSPIRVGRQDSLPEIVSSPTDIGIWEVSHENEAGRGLFARLFRDPRAESPKKETK